MEGRASEPQRLSDPDLVTHHTRQTRRCKGNMIWPQRVPGEAGLVGRHREHVNAVMRTIGRAAPEIPAASSQGTFHRLAVTGSRERSANQRPKTWIGFVTKQDPSAMAGIPCLSASSDLPTTYTALCIARNVMLVATRSLFRRGMLSRLGATHDIGRGENESRPAPMSLTRWRRLPQQHIENPH